MIFHLKKIKNFNSLAIPCLLITSLSANLKDNNLLPKPEEM